jgi:hypothetical protein
MIHIGEPVLKPFLIAMALIYVALISQPVWAKKSDNSGQIPQFEHIVYVDANSTKSGGT